MTKKICKSFQYSSKHQFDTMHISSYQYLILPQALSSACALLIIGSFDMDEDHRVIYISGLWACIVLE